MGGGWIRVASSRIHVGVARSMLGAAGSPLYHAGFLQVRWRVTVGVVPDLVGLSMEV
jgi:hypothetical protein